MQPRPNVDLIARRLSDQIATLLRQEIYQGELRPGQRLPEVELCQRLDVSRAPLREALLLLQKDGLVDIRPHRGATVVEFSDEDIAEVNELRRLLDPVASQAAAERAGPAVEQELHRAFSEFQAAVEHGEPVTMAVAHADLHRTIGRLSGRTLTASFIDLLCTQWLVTFAYGYVQHPEQIQTLISDHLPIVEAIAAGDPDAAVAACEHHFRPIDAMLDSYRNLRGLAGPLLSADAHRPRPATRRR
jgi:DNA-binding GntR family transcriptional regulator